MMAATFRVAKLALGTAAVFTSISCRERTAVLGSTEPLGAPLPVTSTIVLADSFPASGAASAAGCGIVLVGGEWGTVLRIGSDGAVAATGRIFGSPMRTSLERSARDGILFWSNDPPIWGKLNSDLAVDTMAVTRDDWGELIAGPVVEHGDTYLLATLGTISPRASPRPWTSGVLGYRRDLSGSRIAGIGSVKNRGGAYLSWMDGRSVLGSVGDTVLTLQFSEGIISGWVAPYRTPVWVDTLPRQFDAPPPREEISNYPWLQYGGEIRNLLWIPQVAFAGIGEDGTIYAIRNRAAEWENAPHPRLTTQGRWRPTARSIGVYTAHGRLLREYDLPAGIVRWLAVGQQGRIFLRIGSEVLVADLNGAWAHCPVLVKRIVVAASDSPPKPGAFVLYGQSQEITRGR